jgi:hypothetical protein
MRQSSKIGMAGATGLNALVIGSMLLAQGRPAQAQRTESAGDPPRVPYSSAVSGPKANLDLDRQTESRLLIAHGLEMTIEGSTLQGIALRASGVGVGPAIDPRPSPAGVVGSSSVRSIRPAISAPVTVSVPSSTAGTGFTGAPGETVSGRPVGNGNEITPRTPIAGLPGAPQPGITDPNFVTPTAPLTAGQAGSMLQRQAMRAFEAGERLLGQGMTGGPDKAFQQAAERYANTLRAIASQPVIRLTPPATGTTVNTPIGSVTVATTPATTRPAETVGADPASVALINHAVKEAIGAMKIRRMIRNEGGSSGPGGQQLMEHAQMMESESKATIRAFAGIGDAGPVPRAAGELGSPNGMVQVLAQQANDLIIAIQGAALPDAPGPGPGR